MTLRQPPIATLTEARRLHRSGEHSAAARRCRRLLADIADGDVIHDGDTTAIVLDATTLAGLASLEDGDSAQGRTYLEDVQLLCEPRPVWDVIAGIDDIELRNAVAYGQIKLVEVYANDLVEPDVLRRWVDVARTVADASELALVQCFAEYQHLRALRASGRPRAAMRGWLLLEERIRREVARGAHPSGYPPTRSRLEALATAIVLDDLVFARGTMEGLDVSTLDPWDLGFFSFLFADAGQPSPPNVEPLDAERRRTSIGAWFDGLREPQESHVALFRSVLDDAPLAMRLFYPWFSIRRRARRNYPIPSGLFSFAQDTLDEAWRIDAGLARGYGLPVSARSMIHSVDPENLARLITA